MVSGWAGVQCLSDMRGVANLASAGNNVGAEGCTAIAEGLKRNNSLFSLSVGSEWDLLVSERATHGVSQPANDRKQGRSGGPYGDHGQPQEQQEPLQRESHV